MLAGPERGADRALAAELDGVLQHWARVTGGQVARSAGAGAAGGTGHGLLLLGARRLNGIECVMSEVGLAASLRGAGLAVTGEGTYDWQSLRAKIVTGVARTAADTGTPVIVLAGRVQVGRRDMAAMGVEAAYAVADTIAQARVAMARPADTLGALATRVARNWSR
jgi:glycerate kinase